MELRPGRKVILKNSDSLCSSLEEVSIELYETGSDNLRDLQDIFENTDGIYGGRFSGAGFNGSSIALINPDKKEEIADKVRKEYIKRHPNLEKDFAIYFVNTADGIKL